MFTTTEQCLAHRLKRLREEQAKTFAATEATGHLPDSSGIYRITNSVTGETYVGGSVNVSARCRGHWSMMITGNHANVLLQLSVNKQGIAAFTFVLLELCEPDDLWHRERHWMRELKPVLNIKAAESRQRKRRRATATSGK